MTISRYAKSIVYMMFALLFLALSTCFQVAMHKDGLESVYFTSNLYLFVAAVACTGTAVYSYRSFTRRHREHAGDSLFLLIFGLLFLTAAVFNIVSFGGLGDTFTESGYTAANLNIVLMTAMPAPFCVRGWVLALSGREEKRSARGPALLVCAIVTAAYILSVAGGGMMRMVRYDGSSSESSSSETLAEKGV